ncbi:hypothetical protein [Aquisphaera insulae]|uniref:hypothetical protein n=1 Tax=Aquisphaera insulae TaxID=2712864 RepID=UPI0013EC47A5|nr:hypothetical protein [Aquisphaera insulae]
MSEIERQGELRARGTDGRSNRARLRRPRVDRRLGARPIEILEDRRLLAVFTGFSHVRHVPTRTGVFSISIDGPGVVKTVPAGKGVFSIKVLGTSADSSLDISLVRPRFHLSTGLMPVRNIEIRSGVIGSIKAEAVDLEGAVTPLTSSVDTLAFGALGRAAQIEIGGDVGTLNLGTIDLGPTGRVIIAGDANGASKSKSSDTASPAMTVQIVRIDGGRFVIGRDSAAQIEVNGDVTLMHNGLFSIGRDQLAPLKIGGTMTLDTGGVLSVGRNLTALNVNGDLLVNPTGSGVQVGGDLGIDLTGLTVNGIFRGQGSPSAVDLGVGLNLNGLLVKGGTANQGGVQGANINVGKNLNNLDVPHGIFNSYITAGVSINNTTVGADGVIAIYNSEIDATSSINRFTVDGDVKSGFPTGGTTGYPTRIIAGKSRAPQAGATPNQGLYVANGSINNLAIHGTLIDAVLAASVAPYGGDGSLPPSVPYGGTERTSGSPPAGFSNFNAPGGLTDLGGGIATKNYSIRSLIGGVLLPTAVWDTATDPDIHANVLANGTITATVTGGVVSTTHGDSYDYAGVFAVNTLGVDGGAVPLGSSGS